MQISFYVLGDRYVSSNETEVASTASNSEAVLNFVCKLTQTVLTKSDHSLVIIDDDLDRLDKLDKQLWSFDAASFIPHDVLNEPSSQLAPKDSGSNINSQKNKPDDVQSVNNTSIDLEKLSAPVTLLSTLPKGFDGVVLNLAAAPLPLENNLSHPERVLEIITPDDISKEQGRDKYRYYQRLGVELVYHPIK